MKVQESYFLDIEKNVKEGFVGKIFGTTMLKARMLGFVVIGLIVILLLTNMNTLNIYMKKTFDFNEYIKLYLLVIFSFFSWVASKIIYKNYCNSFKSKEALMKEIKRNRLINEELKKANEKLNELSFTDELTKIPNRRSFSDYLDSAYKHNLKKNSLISIIMIDIDYFRKYNNTLGHNEANKVLIAIAQQINETCRNPNDLAARYGGDEFIFAALNTGENEIIELAETIRKKVSELKIPCNNLKKMGLSSLSLGTSTVKVTSKEDIHRCIELADKALYAAKANGRNCVRSISGISNEQTIEYMMRQAN